MANKTITLRDDQFDPNDHDEGDALYSISVRLSTTAGNLIELVSREVTHLVKTGELVPMTTAVHFTFLTPEELDTLCSEWLALKATDFMERHP